MIDWAAFLIVFAASLLAAALIVSLYALGLRLLTVSGRIPVVAPADFTDAITVITPEKAAARARKAAKAAKKNPLSHRQRQLAFAAAVACFVLCGVAVLYGIYLIVPALHG